MDAGISDDAGESSEIDKYNGIDQGKYQNLALKIPPDNYLQIQVIPDQGGKYQGKGANEDVEQKDNPAGQDIYFPQHKMVLQNEKDWIKRGFS